MKHKTEWVGLKFRGKDFGELFEISSDGRVRNIKTGNIYKTKREHLKIRTLVYYKGKSYRVSIGEAQEESGLERTVLDLQPRIARSSDDSATIKDILLRLHTLEEIVMRMVDMNKK